MSEQNGKTLKKTFLKGDGEFFTKCASIFTYEMLKHEHSIKKISKEEMSSWKEFFNKVKLEK